MKIAKVESVPLVIPFSRGVTLKDDPGALNWDNLDFCLVRVETDTGLVGWGDAFAYQCREAVAAAVDHMVAPKAVGRDARDIAGLMHQLQKELHLFGRYGITMFALSGLDIALWDIAAKEAGLPLYRLLGGAGTREVEAYASLFRYVDPDIVAERTSHAVDAGYTYVKLHEITVDAVAAAREAGGEGMPLMVDVNCPWTPEEARHMAMAMDLFDLHWLEEPIFPPDDHAALATLRRQTGVPLAAGENICTAVQFEQMMAAGAVDYAQPSVTKVGGITEFRKIGALAEARGVQIMPHSPYFGPGFLATLHLAQALPNPGLLERIYLFPEAELYPGAYDPQDGVFGAPGGPGLGIEPEPDVIRDFRAPTV